MAFLAPIIRVVLGNYHGLSDVIRTTAVLRDDRRGHDSRPVLRAKRGFRDLYFDIASSITDHANAVFSITVAFMATRLSSDAYFSISYSNTGGFWVTEE